LLRNVKKGEAREGNRDEREGEEGGKRRGNKNCSKVPY